MTPPLRFDIFPPDWGMLRRSRRVQMFLYTTNNSTWDLVNFAMIVYLNLKYNVGGKSTVLLARVLVLLLHRNYWT